MNSRKTNHVPRQKLVLSGETLRQLSLSPMSNMEVSDPPCPKTGTCHSNCQQVGCPGGPPVSGRHSCVQCHRE